MQSGSDCEPKQHAQRDGIRITGLASAFGKVLQDPRIARHQGMANEAARSSSARP